MSGVTDLLDDMKKCEDAEATLALIAICYMCIDAMAYASMPPDQSKNTSRDFINWVNQYLKADPQQPYQYDGRDLWGARCSYFHTFSPSSDFHNNNKDVVKLLYHVGDGHGFDPEGANGYALIEVSTLARDITAAIQLFLKEVAADVEMASIVNDRLNSYFAYFPSD